MEDEVSVYYAETRDPSTGLIKDPEFLGLGQAEAEDIDELKLNPDYEQMLYNQGRGDLRYLKLSVALKALKDPLATLTQKEQAKRFIQQFKK